MTELICDADGIRLSPGLVLAERRGTMIVPHHAHEIFRRLAPEFGADLDWARLNGAVGRAARFLTDGRLDAAQKVIETVRLPRPLAKYNSNHYGPGPKGGQFAPADDDSVDDASPVHPAAARRTNRREPWFGQPHPAFREKIAEAERSAGKPNNGYGATNRATNALGRYQLTPIALKEAGWIDGNGTWNPAKGVTSTQQFLNDPDAQERAMGDVMRHYELELKANGSYRYVGRTYWGVNGPITITEAGLIAAAHRQGAGEVAKYLTAVRAHRWQSADVLNDPTLDKRTRDKWRALETRLRVFQEVPY